VAPGIAPDELNSEKAALIDAATCANFASSTVDIENRITKKHMSNDIMSVYVVIHSGIGGAPGGSFLALFANQSHLILDLARHNRYTLWQGIIDTSSGRA
jgi:hypothetical protein